MIVEIWKIQESTKEKIKMDYNLIIHLFNSVSIYSCI